MLAMGELHTRVVDAGQAAVVVDGDDLPDRLIEPSMERLQSLAAVVVATVEDPTARTPRWADVVVGRGSRNLEAVLDTVGRNPMASTTLAVLLRTGEGRSVPAGLVAESTTYGLLQGGPEFDRWRSSTPARTRPEVSGPVVLVSRHDHELSITLDRPHVLNAFNARMRDELLDAVGVATADPTITSVTLRGSGGSFCSGGIWASSGHARIRCRPIWCACSATRAGLWLKWPTGQRRTSTDRRWAQVSSWLPSPTGWWPIPRPASRSPKWASDSSRGRVVPSACPGASAVTPPHCWRSANRSSMPPPRWTGDWSTSSTADLGPGRRRRGRVGPGWGIVPRRRESLWLAPLSGDRPPSSHPMDTEPSPADR